MSEASTLSSAAPIADAQHEIKSIRVSRASARHNRILADCDLAEVVEQIRTGSGGVRPKVERIREKFWEVMDATNGDRQAAKDAVHELKLALPAVMSSGTFTRRCDKALSQHSGFICIDIDGLGRDKVPEVIAKLQSDSPFLYTAFPSPTGDGVKALIRVSANGQKHNESYRAVKEHVRQLLDGIEIDESCKNVGRLCFLSYDPNLYVNEEAVELPLLAEPEEPPRQQRAEQFGGDDPRLETRRTIAKELLGDIDWENESRGLCTCPSQHLHTTGDGKRDCEVYLDKVPTIHCFHESCRGIVAGVNHELRSRIAKAENGGQGRGSLGPVEWFNAKFPSLSAEYGNAVLIQQTKNGSLYVGDISEDFLAATLSEKGTKDSPTVFVPTEQKFYMYAPGDGIYNYRRDADLITSLSKQSLDCARESNGFVDTRSLEFRLRSSTKLAGVLKKGQGLLAVPDDFFSTGLTEFIPCANGMLRLSDRELLPFSPTYRRRNKLAVPFDPEAKCSVFLNTLLLSALDPDEIDLLQRWCGLALIGENLAQRFLILSGTAGGGKGTFIRVLVGIIGQQNVATLRTRLLNERFEIGRFLGKTLLYGADVPEDFLNQRGASVLKSLTGYDPMTLEFKKSNESPIITGRFNAIVTCNSRLTVHLEGDTDAWRRRLAIINYQKPKPARVIADLDQLILRTERSGVLSWMLEGLDKIRADEWELHLTPAQQRVVDNLLLESESHIIFAREALFPAPGTQLTTEDCHGAYLRFCSARGWIPLGRNKFSELIGDVVARTYGLTVRNDLAVGIFTKRGWKGLQVSELAEEALEKDLE
jgi:putative DNA primase/helicase